MAKHYIIADESRRVLRGFSDDFEQPESNAICICEDGGRHFELNGIINPPLTNADGVAIYQIVNGVVIERSADEILADTVPPVRLPTIEDRTAALESALLEMIIGGAV